MRGALLVVHVAGAGPMPQFAPLGPGTTGALPADQVEAARQLAADILAGSTVAWTFTVKTGEAATELDRLATGLGTGVIVTGRSRFPTRHLLGSVPTRLVRHARCPITVVA